MGKMRDICFRSNDPLINQPVKNYAFRFRFPIDELLIPAQRSNVAQENDVVFHARHDPVHHLLPGHGCGAKRGYRSKEDQ
jgi:hypothetical protein